MNKTEVREKEEGGRGGETVTPKRIRKREGQEAD